MEKPFENISDTAFLVATYRAIESERPDALFTDPFARKLTGEHGKRILERLNPNKEHSWFLVSRTTILDKKILSLIETEKIDTVLNLAAGLDTRAYRLALPKDLRWYDVDLPEILGFKETALKNEIPKCRLEYVKLDLANSQLRKSFLEKVAGESKRTLVICEGILMYLSAEEVETLARELRSFGNICYWVAELIGPLQLKIIKRRWGKFFKAANAEMKFAPANPEEIFEGFGWKWLEFYSTMENAFKIGRLPEGAWILGPALRFLPKPWTQSLRRTGICVMKNPSAH